MTLDDLDTWWVMYSQFLGADSGSGIYFALNNDLEARYTYTVRIVMTENGQRKRLLTCVTLRDLDPGATVYGI